jgi:hypothetical protein
MGRHGDTEPAPRHEVLGWGGFAIAVTVVLMLATGSNWRSAALLALLGAGATTALWVAGRLSTRRDAESPGQGPAEGPRPRRTPGHAAGGAAPPPGSPDGPAA